MRFLLLLLLALLPEILVAQTAKTIGNRAQDQLLKLDVNVAGTPTVAATFGDPANCATSGATLCGGLYTPTDTSLINLTSVALFESTFSRNGPIVTVGFRANVDPVSSATATSFELNLPIASNFTISTDASGSCGMSTGSPGGVVSNDSVTITANTTTDKFSIQWVHTSAGGGAVIFPLTCVVQYRIK